MQSEALIQLRISHRNMFASTLLLGRYNTVQLDMWLYTRVEQGRDEVSQPYGGNGVC